MTYIFAVFSLYLSNLNRTQKKVKNQRDTLK